MKTKSDAACFNGKTRFRTYRLIWNRVLTGGFFLMAPYPCPTLLCVRVCVYMRTYVRVYSLRQQVCVLVVSSQP